MRFYFPLKPTRISIDSSIFQRCESDPNFILQIKKNGWRVQIHKDKDKIEFFTRHKERLEAIATNADWNLLSSLIKNIKADSAVIDGEFIHRRGTRKNTIYVWDIFEYDGAVQKKTYKQRKELLNSIVQPNTNLLLAEDYVDNFMEVWDNLNEEEDEGIVLKDLREDLYINYSKTIESARQFKILLEDRRNKTVRIAL